MNENEKALDALIDEAMEQEKSLSLRAEELSLQSKQFADYLAEKKHNDEKLEVLWDLVKEYMTENTRTIISGSLCRPLVGSNWPRTPILPMWTTTSATSKRC